MKICKKCFKCETEKSIDAFYKHKKMRDGHLNKCMECTKLDELKRYKNNYKNTSWVLKERERCRLKSKKYIGIGMISVAQKEAQKDYIKRNPEKRKAHILVGNALRSGKLKKMPCIKCNSPASEAHHEDYSKPLEVIWLCKRHHADRHIEINEESLKKQ